VEVVARGYALAEAPVWDGRGLIFSSVLSGGVFRVDPGGRPETVLAKRRGVGGAALHADGRLIVTGRDVLCGDEVLLGHEAGITGYNDCGTLADGTLLVGGLRFNGILGEAPVPATLFRIAPDDEIEHVELPHLMWPNGIACAPDGETFYVADYATGTVWRNATERFVDVAGGEADGLAVDAEGAVLVATGNGKTIERHLPDGTLHSTLDVDTQFVSSLCFGGADLQDLYVTTADAVLRTRADVPGFPVPPARV
jgi:sugar lactone lactonase YvrE